MITAGYVVAQAQFKNAQKCVGLRPYLVNIPTNPMIDPSMTEVDAETKASLFQTRKDLLALPRISSDEASPFPIGTKSRIVCIDVEAWERDHNVITELGVAVLDTNLAALVAPGPNAINWRDLIEAKHYCVDEYEHLRNTTFVNPGATYIPKFRYGETTTIKSNELEGILQELLQTENDSDMVLIGHNPKSDMSFLGKTMPSIGELPATKHILDTQMLWQALNAPGVVQQQTKLENILTSMKISCSSADLHNAGNDAYLTMSAFLAMLLTEATIRPEESVYPRIETNNFCSTKAGLVDMSTEQKELMSADLSSQRQSNLQILQGRVDDFAEQVNKLKGENLHVSPN